MTFSFITMTALLGTSVVIAYVLHPPREEPAASAVSHHRYQGDSWQSMRKGLLRALNMQTEPRLPAGGLDSVREQWKRTFSTISHGAKHTATISGNSESQSPDSGNSIGQKCCSVATEVLMKDLGWDSWVIHPVSLTVVQCALCNSATNTVQCPSSHSNAQDATSQDPVLCCQPTSHEMVPIIYIDESNTIVISSMQLTRSCGWALGNVQQPNTE